MAKGKMNKRRTKLLEILLEKKRVMWNELRNELFQTTGEGLHSQFNWPSTRRIKGSSMCSRILD